MEYLETPAHNAASCDRAGGEWAVVVFSFISVIKQARCFPVQLSQHQMFSLSEWLDRCWTRDTCGNISAMFMAGMALLQPQALGAGLAPGEEVSETVIFASHRGTPTWRCLWLAS